jgi:alpha-tubulin suppressor-like RCC1 family protein
VAEPGGRRRLTSQRPQTVARTSSSCVPIPHSLPALGSTARQSVAGLRRGRVYQCGRGQMQEGRLWVEYGGRLETPGRRESPG